MPVGRDRPSAHRTRMVSRPVRDIGGREAGGGGEGGDKVAELPFLRMPRDLSMIKGLL